MAKVLFKRKTTAEINQLEVEDGALIYNTDNGKTYMDFGNNRIQTGGNADTMIAIGGEEPTDEDIKLWINPDKMVKSPSNIIDMVYPVGSYYETSDKTFNPNVTWGGTWELETDGTVLVSKSTTSGSKFNVDVGTVIGEEKHTLTIDEMPKHTHGVNYWLNSNLPGGNDRLLAYGNSGTPYNTKLSSWIDNEGNNQPHNNVQPSKIVNRWHRTA